MNYKTIERYEVLVAGIETTTAAVSLIGNTTLLSERADALQLAERIRYRRDPTSYLTVIWNWSPDGEFPLLMGVEVESLSDQPEICVTYRFPVTDFAVVPMEGKMPNLVEPWKAILSWYPGDPKVLTTVIRRYDEQHRTGELLVPLADSPITPG